MTTREIASLVKYQFNALNKIGSPGIVTLINQAQNLFYMHEHPENIVMDTATGDFPFLATQANVYEYTCPDDCWRTAEILVSADVYPLYGNTILDDYGRYVNIQKPTDFLHYNGKQYARYQQIRTKDKTENGNATVLFTALDPGDTTDRYLHRYYGFPTPITTIGINPTMASPYDFEFLLPAVQSLCDGLVNGTYREMMEYVRLKLVPAYWNKVGGGEQSMSYHVTRNKF